MQVFSEHFEVAMVTNNNDKQQSVCYLLLLVVVVVVFLFFAGCSMSIRIDKTTQQ